MCCEQTVTWRAENEEKVEVPKTAVPQIPTYGWFNKYGKLGKHANCISVCL